jgi:hypothetical protein
MAMLEAGVFKHTIHFSADGEGPERHVSIGSLLVNDGAETEPGDEPILALTLYTLDRVRLADTLEAVAAGRETPDGALLALDAVALASEPGAVEDDGDDDDDEITYWRPELISTLTAHQHLSTGGCSCGNAPWGGSFADHVADAYEALAR